MSYAVVWNVNEDADSVGELELVPGALRLHGVGKDALELQVDVSVDDLDEIYLERCAPAKNPWEPALVLVTRAGDRIAIGSLEGIGALHELAESVAHAHRQVAA